jgi:adenosine/AMP kinase
MAHAVFGILTSHVPYTDIQSGNFKSSLSQCQADIPMSFTQIKVCVADSNIYLASDDGDFIRYSPNNRSFVKCCDQKYNTRGISHLTVIRNFGNYFPVFLFNVVFFYLTDCSPFAGATNGVAILIVRNQAKIRTTKF